MFGACHHILASLWMLCAHFDPSIQMFDIYQLKQQPEARDNQVGTGMRDGSVNVALPSKISN